MTKDISLLPLLNEKTYDLSKAKNVFVFKVPLNVNKLTIIQAIKNQFDVEAVSVNTLVSKGKVKRTMSITGKRALSSKGKRPDFKKVYVTLKKGQSLPFFESLEEDEEKRQATQEKFDQAAKKQAEKETKQEAKNKATPMRRFLRKSPESK